MVKQACSCMLWTVSLTGVGPTCRLLLFLIKNKKFVQNTQNIKKKLQKGGLNIKYNNNKNVKFTAKLSPLKVPPMSPTPKTRPVVQNKDLNEIKSNTIVKILKVHYTLTVICLQIKTFATRFPVTLLYRPNVCTFCLQLIKQCQNSGK